MAQTSQAWTPWQVSGRGRGPETIPDGVQDICLFLASGFCGRGRKSQEAGEMDEIGQDPKLNVRIPRAGRWLDVAVAVALIAAAAIAVMTGRGSRPAASPAGGPGAAAAPALLPSTVRTQIPLPFGQPGEMTILGSTAWVSDWPYLR